MMSNEKLFEKWADENEIICPWRSRFDCMHEAIGLFAKTTTDPKEILRHALEVTGWGQRYPKIPKDL